MPVTAAGLLILLERLLIKSCVGDSDTSGIVNRTYFHRNCSTTRRPIRPKLPSGLGMLVQPVVILVD
jgi:hypothetical protein